MPETLLLYSQETLPEDLVFERLDDDGSGIAMLSDGRYVVEVGQHLTSFKGNKEINQRYDLSLAAQFIEQEPEIADWYGYRRIPSGDSGLARVIIPSLEQLNERKNSLPVEICVNRSVFKEQEGAHFGAIEYLAAIGEGIVPIATESDAKAHDLGAHTGGFAIMSSELFDFMSAAAKDALERGDDYFAEKHRGDVTGMIDQISGWLTGHTTSESTTSPIGMVHGIQMPRDEKKALIDLLQESQLRTNEAFRAYVSAQRAAEA